MLKSVSNFFRILIYMKNKNKNKRLRLKFFTTSWVNLGG